MSTENTESALQSRAAGPERLKIVRAKKRGENGPRELETEIAADILFRHIEAPRQYTYDAGKPPAPDALVQRSMRLKKVGVKTLQNAKF